MPASQSADGTQIVDGSGQVQIAWFHIAYVLMPRRASRHRKCNIELAVSVPSDKMKMNEKKFAMAIAI